MSLWKRVAVGVSVWAAPLAWGQAAPYSRMSVEQQKALVGRYCSDCHNPDLKSGGMTLTDLDLAHPERSVELAEKVIRKLDVKMMPPPGKDRPDAATIKLFASSLAGRVDDYAKAHPDLGNPPLHRMNRAEYANTIHEMLGVDVSAEKLLPSDDMSHGFDNMADVLTFSPALMEAYVRAAANISRQALGERDALPLSSTYEVPRVVSQVHHVDGAPFGTRGGVSIVHNFPADGYYTFKLGFYFSLDGPLFGATLGKSQQIEISVNGERAALFSIDPTMTKFDEMRTPPIRVKAGPQRVSAAFLQTADGPMEDAVEPVGFSLLDLNQAELPGLTTLPHLHELTITGPTTVTGVSETPSRRKIFSCYPANKSEEGPCARQIVARLTTEAYRRPVRSEEVARLMKLYALGYVNGGFEGGIGVALQAILANPSFVYRFEGNRAHLQRASTAVAAAYPLTDLELASRLSFFLWSASPDATLLKLGEEHRLHEPAVLRAQVRRMLADRRSISLSNNFASEWLHLQNLKGVQPDGYLYPDYNRNLGDAMREETILFFNSIVKEDRSVLTLLDGRYTYVNEQLAKLYGIPNVQGSRFRKVQLTDENRFGLLGQASLLTLTSGSNRTSPVIRGKYVMEVFLGTPPPPPPPNVPALKDHGADGGVQTVRARLEEHRKNPTCASCHKFMDPIGFALENYDPIGGWRGFDSGAPIDAKGKLFDGTPLDGPASLRKALLAHSDDFLGTFTESLFAYGVGRVLRPVDMPEVRSIEAYAAGHDNSFSSFVMGIVNSAPFRMRAAEPALPNRLQAILSSPDLKVSQTH